MDTAAAAVEEIVPKLADKATEDITDVAGAAADSTRQAAADVSKTIEDMAHDVAVCCFFPSTEALLLRPCNSPSH